MRNTTCSFGQFDSDSTINLAQHTLSCPICVCSSNSTTEHVVPTFSPSDLLEPLDAALVNIQHSSSRSTWAPRYVRLFYGVNPVDTQIFDQERLAIRQFLRWYSLITCFDSQTEQERHRLTEVWERFSAIDFIGMCGEHLIHIFLAECVYTYRCPRVGRYNTFLLETILANMRDPDVPDSDGRSALFIICDRRSTEGRYINRRDYDTMINILVQAGAHLDCRSLDGRSVLDLFKNDASPPELVSEQQRSVRSLQCLAAERVNSPRGVWRKRYSRWHGRQGHRWATSEDS